MIDIAKNGFHQEKLHFKENKLGDLNCILKSRSCWKVITKIVTVGKTIKSWILFSVATLETHKSESGMKKNAINTKNYNKIAIGVIFDHAHGRHRST